jgi:hypothetical protein
MPVPPRVKDPALVALLVAAVALMSPVLLERHRADEPEQPGRTGTSSDDAAGAATLESAITAPAERP